MYLHFYLISFVNIRFIIEIDLSKYRIGEIYCPSIRLGSMTVLGLPKSLYLFLWAIASSNFGNRTTCIVHWVLVLFRCVPVLLIWIATHGSSYNRYNPLSYLIRHPPSWILDVRKHWIFALLPSSSSTSCCRYTGQAKSKFYILWTLFYFSDLAVQSKQN